MDRTVLRDVEVEGVRVDVELTGEWITAMGAGLHPVGGAEEIDGYGGALLPGLHDHHLHVLALAAARSSVDCSRSLAPLATAPGTPWVRGVNYHENVAGAIDRYVLDRVVPDRPVRVQHRSGALWILNSMALAVVASVLDSSADVERDATGEPTGRLWRFDSRLRPALPSPSLELVPLAGELASYGLTSVTDATPDLDPEAIEILRRFLLPVTMLGDPDGTAPRKLLLRDHDLPAYPDLLAVVTQTHASGRAVAVHCVTRDSLLLTLAVLEEAGPLPGDRIEHAAVVPEPASLRGLRVITQPGFLLERGDDYVRDVAPHDLPHLYRYGALLRSGVDVVASSDAPFGPVDPWAVIRAARDRTTRSGLVLGPDEHVTARTVLSGYLTDPRGAPRSVAPGRRADLCLLHVPLAEALSSPDAAHVRRTWVGGDDSLSAQHHLP